jgi:hypothetical protein
VARYRAEAKLRENLKGFAAGVRAMRDTLAAQMALFGEAVFSGVEVAGMIRAVDTRELERQFSGAPEDD